MSLQFNRTKSAIGTLTVLAFAAGAAQAQSSAANDFPAGASALEPQVLRDRLSGKVFAATMADGSRWRLQFQTSGHAFVNAGPMEYKGTWSVEDNRLCTDLTRIPRSCSEIREKEGTLYMKRASNGEIAVLAPQ